MNVQVLHKLLEYKNTLQSLIWVDEQSMNPTALLKGHWHLEPSAGDMETNPVIILSWRCTKLAELVIFGKYNKFKTIIMHITILLWSNKQIV